MTGFGGGGYGWVGIVLTLVFLALIVVGIVLVARGRGDSGEPRVASPPPGAEYPPKAAPQSAALAVLEERYARGEIDREEFMIRKSDLTG
ncbi:MAG: SHOCT domain-containing protein [Actinobacteria bacterium]|nr:SHOCT domain-containing protein [Actinomycetota bacterium]